jgi:hypothetical protein
MFELELGWRFLDRRRYDGFFPGVCRDQNIDLSDQVIDRREHEFDRCFINESSIPAFF